MKGDITSVEEPMLLLECVIGAQRFGVFVVV